MGAAVALLAQYHREKRSVCFNADKADIFRGFSHTIPMKERSPIWQRSLSEILSVMLDVNRRDKTLGVSAHIKLQLWAAGYHSIALQAAAHRSHLLTPLHGLMPLSPHWKLSQGEQVPEIHQLLQKGL